MNECVPMDDSRHPWLDGLPHVATLSEVQRIWTFLAANCASGNLAGVAEDWGFLPAEKQVGGIEVILQTHLFAGYPRSINALSTVRQVGVAADGLLKEGAPRFPEWAQQGESLCRQIYGDAYEKLRQHMGALHPDLNRWMVETGYGRVLSRPGLTLRERELCVVAVLAGQNVAPQLRSHLRGALNAGATLTECDAILAQTGLAWGPTAEDQTYKLWCQLRPRLARI